MNNRINVMLIGALLAASTGCGGKGGMNEIQYVSVPDEVVIALGGKANVILADVTVKVDRSKAKFDEANITVSDLPNGVYLVEQNIAISKDQNEAKFKLKVEKDAKPVQMHKARISVSMGQVTETTDLNISLIDYHLSAGWIVMIISVGSVLVLISFCLFRVLTLPPVEEEEALERDAPGVAVSDQSDKNKADASDNLQGGVLPEDDGTSEQIKPAE